MFKVLREKLSGWFGKKKEEVVEEQAVEERVDKEKHVEERVAKEVVEDTPLSIPEEEKVVAEEKIDEVEEDSRKKSEGFFSKLKKKLLTSVLKQEEFDDIFLELEMVLLENNVAYEVVEKIHESLSKDLVGISVKKKSVDNLVEGSLKDSILEILVEGRNLFEEIKKSLETYVILFFGVNGGGKTTTIAKIAWKLKKEGLSCVLAACDTFRAASIEQLEKHADKIGVGIVKGRYGKDPASVAFDAIVYAKKNKKKVVLIDTAGRMYTKANLMKEMEKIVRVAKPDFKIFVGESITGNDAVSQAKTFNEAVGIDGIVLTKADVDEKAGAILSVGFITGKPILFLGTGQGYGDLEEFKKKNVLKNLGLED